MFLTAPSVKAIALPGATVQRPGSCSRGTLTQDTFRSPSRACPSPQFGALDLWEEVTDQGPLERSEGAMLQALKNRLGPYAKSKESFFSLLPEARQYLNGDFLLCAEYLCHFLKEKLKPESIQKGSLLLLSEAHLHLLLGKADLALGNYSEGIEALKKADLPYERIAPDFVERAEIFTSLSRAYTDLGAYDQAFGYLAQAFTFWEKERQINYSQVVKRLQQLNATSPKPFKFKDLIDKANGSPRGEMIAFFDTLHQNGELFLALGKIKDAQLAFSQVNDLYQYAVQDAGGAVKSGRMKALNRLGEIAALQGHSKEANQYFQDVITLFNQSGRQEDPLQYAKALYHRGSLLARDGRFEQAFQQFKTAQQVFRQVLGPHYFCHPERAFFLMEYGHFYEQLQGDKQKWAIAFSRYRKAHEILKACYGENHPATIVAYSALARGVVLYPKAGEILSQSVSDIERTLLQGLQGLGETLGPYNPVFQEQVRDVQAIFQSRLYTLKSPFLDTWEEKLEQVKDQQAGPILKAWLENTLFFCRSLESYSGEPVSLSAYQKLLEACSSLIGLLK